MKKYSLIAILVMLFCVTASAQEMGKVIGEKLERGNIVPNIVGKTVEGKDFDLRRDYKGKVVLIDFWATWCGPCVAEVPGIVANYEKWHSQGFEVIGVSLDKKVELAKAKIKKMGMKWPTICDGLAHSGPIAKKYSVSAIPLMILLDRDGKVHTINARGPALSNAIKIAIKGENSANIDSMAMQELEVALTSGTPSQSLKIAEALIDSAKYDPDKLSELAYVNCRKENMHAETILAMTLALHNQTEYKMSYMIDFAKGAAALELGGYYVADMAMNNLRRNRKNALASELFMLKAIKLGASDTAWDNLQSSILNRSIDYSTSLKYYKKLKGLDSTDSVSKRKLEHYFKMRRSQDVNRTDAVREGNLFKVNYRNQGTVLSAALTLKVWVRFDNTQFIKFDLADFNKGIHSASIKIPAGTEKIQYYFSGSDGNSDSNAGAFWEL